MSAQLEKMQQRYEELEQLLSSAPVIADREQYNRLAKELAGLQEPVRLSRQCRKIDGEIAGLEAALLEPHDREFLDMVNAELLELRARRQELERSLKDSLTGDDPDLGKDVIVEIRSGTGGEEAALFAADLLRMYSQYAAAKGWSVETMSSNPTQLGGLKEVVISVKGKEAYKRLKFESGVHRVQRVPDTEAQGRIHTSTATVAVLMEAAEVDLVIEPKDLRIDTYRSSGPGGQHMQKTDSAVRITHLPTGLVVACQDERSQIKNKNKAMRILRSRILDARREAEAKKLTQERRAQIGSGDRSEKIRTYNYPDRRLTDHRINFTLYRLPEVLDGDLEELSDALLKAEQEKRDERV